METEEKTKKEKERRFPLKSMKTILVSIIGVEILLLGGLLLASQAVGYTVYYDGIPVGFVDTPEQVLDNLNKMSIVISEETEWQTVFLEEKFDFDKGMRFFTEKDPWVKVARTANEKCQIDVNVYEVYVDDQLVLQGNHIQNVEVATNQIKEEYAAANPEEEYDKIDFAEDVELKITTGKTVEDPDPQSMYETLHEKLTVETIKTTVEEAPIPYEVVYEETDTIPEGEFEVVTSGVEGKKRVQTVLIKHDGEEFSNTASETVVEEPVNEVVRVGTLEVEDALLAAGEGLPDMSAATSDTATGEVLFSSQTTPIIAGGFVQPTTGVLTSRMGFRWGRMHKGIDIGAPTGTPAYAARGGKVIVAGYNTGGYGNMVKVDHGDGVVTLYAHLSAIAVQQGDMVQAGQLVGRVGSTGNSTGPHLHFEVIINGSNVDPLKYVSY